MKSLNMYHQQRLKKYQQPRLENKWEKGDYYSDKKQMGSKKTTSNKNYYLENSWNIRHNGIRWNEMEIMAEGLKKNHSILGIHVKGNEAWVDSWGFIRPLHDYQMIEVFFDITLNKKNSSGVFSNI